MRLKHRERIEIPSGQVIVCDPGYVFEYTDSPPNFELPPNAALFDGFGGDGGFKAYRRDNCVIIDTAPRLFRAGTRSDFRELPGRVCVDSGCIVFLDAASSIVEAVGSLSSDSYVSFELPPGEHVAWEEEHDMSESHRRMILGIAEEPVILMAGENANTIERIEQTVARTLRMKGPEKGEALNEIRQQILDLHWSGNKDQRLHMLASAVRLELPARRGRRRS